MSTLACKQCVLHYTCTNLCVISRAKYVPFALQTASECAASKRLCVACELQLCFVLTIVHVFANKRWEYALVSKWICISICALSFGAHQLHAQETRCMWNAWHNTPRSHHVRYNRKMSVLFFLVLMTFAVLLIENLFCCLFILVLITFLFLHIWYDENRCIINRSIFQFAFWGAARSLNLLSLCVSRSRAAPALPTLHDRCPSSRPLVRSLNRAVNSAFYFPFFFRAHDLSFWLYLFVFYENFLVSYFWKRSSLYNNVFYSFVAFRLLVEKNRITFAHIHKVHTMALCLLLCERCEKRSE